MVKKGYRAILVDKTQIEVADLEALRECALTGKITPQSPLYDNESGKLLLAGDHPFLEGFFPPPSPLFDLSEDEPKPTLTAKSLPTHVGDYAVPPLPVPIPQHPIFCASCHAPNAQESVYCIHCSKLFPTGEGEMVYCINPVCKCALMPHQQVCLRCHQGQNRRMQEWITAQYHLEKLWENARRENVTWYVCYRSLCVQDAHEARLAIENLDYRLSEITLALRHAETNLRVLQQAGRTQGTTILGQNTLQMLGQRLYVFREEIRVVEHTKRQINFEFPNL